MRRMGLHVLESVRFANSVWNLPPTYVEALRGKFPDVHFTSPPDQGAADALLPDAEVVIGWAVNAGNFSTAQRLRWVHATAAGVGLLMFPAMIASDVIVTNSRGLHADAMAEHTLGVMLSFVRQLHRSRDAQRERRWAQEEMWTVPPEFGTLAGSTLLLVGLGAVGGAIASRARSLGVRVIAVRRNPRPDPAPADEQWSIAELPRLLPRADWLVLAAPLTDDTRHLIGAKELSLLKRSAVLVNVGRGHLVDEPALVAALSTGTLGGAALDVFEQEPLSVDSPLWEMTNVLLTPHVSGLAPDYWGRAMVMFEDNLRRFTEGRPLLNVVDKKAGY
jgi:phosphoglycerate dehydrogenase-like enzyme